MTRRPLPQLPSEQAWRTRAACAGTDPRRYTDPEPGSDETRRALATCRSCPVRLDCLTEALQLPAEADVGIWGATTEQTRRTMRRTRPTPHPISSPSTGLFDTLDGDLVDLTGRALITRLPSPPSYLLFIDGQPALRTEDLDDVWRHILGTLEQLQPQAVAPFTLTADGELTDPTRRALITRLPVAPHLLVVIDGQPHTRTDQLDTARRHALASVQHPAPDLEQRHHHTGPLSRVSLGTVDAIARPSEPTPVARRRAVTL